MELSLLQGIKDENAKTKLILDDLADSYLKIALDQNPETLKDY